MAEHLPGVSTRRDGRSSPMVEYGQTARRTAEYRLVGAGGRRDGEVQATDRRTGEGWCRRRQSIDGRERGICVQIVGFACSLADRAGPFPLFSRPESPSVPRGTGDSLGSSDGLRPKSEGKRGTGRRDWTEYRRPDVKNGRRGPSRGTAGDAVRYRVSDDGSCNFLSG
jgi:hypothetical protein